MEPRRTRISPESTLKLTLLWLVCVVVTLAYCRWTSRTGNAAEDLVAAVLSGSVGFAILAYEFQDRLGIDISLPQFPWTDWLEKRRWDQWWKEAARQFAESESGKRWLAQLQDVRDGREIPPPWIEFPHDWGLGPLWGGWRQGAGEWWLHSVWLPYWSTLSENDRHVCLDRNEADEYWRDYLEPGRRPSFFSACQLTKSRDFCSEDVTRWKCIEWSPGPDNRRL